MVDPSLFDWKSLHVTETSLAVAFLTGVASVNQTSVIVKTLDLCDRYLIASAETMNICNILIAAATGAALTAGCSPIRVW
jgi:hypothetical protein